MGNIPQQLVVLAFIKTLKTDLPLHTKLQNVKLSQQTIETRISHR